MAGTTYNELSRNMMLLSSNHTSLDTTTTNMMLLSYPVTTHPTPVLYHSDQHYWTTGHILYVLCPLDSRKIKGIFVFRPWLIVVLKMLFY